MRRALSAREMAMRAAARNDAVRILRGCAQGATEASLLGMGIELDTLTQLVRAGRVRTWEERLHKPDITVRWYACA